MGNRRLKTCASRKLSNVAKKNIVQENSVPQVGKQVFDKRV